MLCYVNTVPKYLDKRTKYVKETWAKKCNKTLYVSDEDNSAFPTIKVTNKTGYQQMWAKTRNTLLLLYKEYFPMYDWYFKADDDTYVVMDNLRKFLHQKNSSERQFYGKFFIHRSTKQGFPSGGAGYAIGNTALDRLINIGFKSGPNCPSDKLSENKHFPSTVLFKLLVYAFRSCTIEFSYLIFRGLIFRTKTQA